MTLINSIIKTDQQQLKKIWGLAWPVIIGQFLHTLMVIADMWFVGRLGKVETAAVGAATSVIGVIHVVPFLIATGSIALVSRLTGADDQEGIKGITQQGMILSFFVGIIVVVFSYYNINLILRIFGGTDVEMLGQSRQYIQVALLGIPLFFFNATTRGILQATGDTKNPVKVFVAMNLLNILLDYLFIMVFKLGIGGAAAATALSEAVGSLLMGSLIMRHIFNFDIKGFIKHLKIEMNTSIRILKIGGYSAL